MCISLRKRLKKNRYVANTDCGCCCGYFTFVNIDSIFVSSYLHVVYQSHNILLEFRVSVRIRGLGKYLHDEMRLLSCLVRNNRHGAL